MDSMGAQETNQRKAFFHLILLVDLLPLTIGRKTVLLPELAIPPHTNLAD